ncbi:UDP-galactose transporter [Pseudozyma hubeiensis]|nr:UDP-galactose transporter [Pseudozyma hubeiensis]
MSASLTSLIAAISAIRSGVGIVQHQAIRHVAYSPYLTVLLIESVKISCASILLTRALHKERQADRVDQQATYTKLATDESEEDDRNASTDHLVSDAPEAELPNASSTPKTLYHHVLSQIFARQGLRLIVPALLYVAQNNLCLVGATELDPAFFQALWQMRLLVSAVLSRFVLKRQILWQQWMCILGIFGGVLCVKYATMGHAHGEKVQVGHKELSSTALATLQVATAAVLSSVAGITLEYIFRDRTVNLWASNVQLSAFSIPSAALLVMLSDKQKLAPVVHDLTHSFWPVSVVVFHSINGMLVAVMLKKAGVIVNDLASALSIILMFVLNSALFPSDNQVKGFGKIAVVCVGSASILASTISYQGYGNALKQKAQEDAAAVAQEPLPMSPISSSPSSTSVDLLEKPSAEASVPVKPLI